VQVTINTTSPTEREVAIDVAQEELQPHFDKAYEDFRPKAELRGFRKGKVPLPMIKRIYGEAIERDAIDEVANTLYRQAMEERSIQPIGTPSMVKMDFKRKEYLHFTVKYEVKPEIVLQNYRGLAVERPVWRITDADVEQEIHHLRQANSTAIEVDKVADSEHVVLADLQELDETGTPLIGKKKSGARFYLADPTLAPEAREALKSAKTGETYRVKYETKHRDHGHNYHLDITVTKIQKLQLPPYDEALVKTITAGKVTSPEEFRTTLRADLEKYWEEQGTNRVNDAIANELVRMHEFPIPESLVEAFLQSFLDDIKSRTNDRRLPAEFDEEKFRNENRAYAVWQAKWTLLKEAIARQENLTVTDEDLAALAEQEATKIGIDKSRLLEYYKRSSSAAERLLSDKVMTFLRAQAKLKEKVLEREPA
jgi:trigger factor